MHSVEYLRRLTGYRIADGSVSATLPLAVLFPLLESDSNDKNKSNETLLPIMKILP